MDPLLHRELDSRIIRDFLDPGPAKRYDITSPSSHKLALIGCRPNLVTLLNPLEYATVRAASNPFPLHMKRVIPVLAGGSEVAIRLT